VFRKKDLSLAQVCQGIRSEFRPLVFENRTFLVRHSKIDEFPFDYLQGTITLILRLERMYDPASALTLLCRTIEREGVRVYLENVRRTPLKVSDTASYAMKPVFPDLQVGPSTPVIAFDCEKSRVQ
jgi:hypothetical protein